MMMQFIPFRREASTLQVSSNRIFMFGSESAPLLLMIMAFLCWLLFSCGSAFACAFDF